MSGSWFEDPQAFTLTPTHSVSNISVGQEQCWPVKHLNTGATASPFPVFGSAVRSLSLSLECLSSIDYLVSTCLYILYLPDPTTGKNDPSSGPHQMSSSLKLTTTSYSSLKAQQLAEGLAYRRKSVIVLWLN